MQSSDLFGIATVTYILAMMFYIGYLIVRANGLGVAATVVTIVGFISQTLGFIYRGIEFHAVGQMGFMRAIPLTNLYESLIFFVWSLILIYLIIEFKFKTRNFGAFVTPIAGLALAFIEMSGMSKGIQPLVPALQSNWLLVHVFMSFISYALFSLAFSTGLLYLMSTSDNKKEFSYIFWTVTLGVFIVVLGAMGLDFVKYRAMAGDTQSLVFKATFMNTAPMVRFISILGGLGLIFCVWNYGASFKKLTQSLGLDSQMLEEITYRSIAIGFPIFTLGGLIFGAIWADQAWGTYWSWDPKETWSLITWFVYAFFLHARIMRGWRGKAVAIVAVVGFVAVIFTYLGVNLLLSGLHSYGAQ